MKSNESDNSSREDYSSDDDYLDMNDRIIDDEIASSIGDILKTKDATIKSLCIKNTAISTLGIKLITDALKTNKTLEMLYISGNKIGFDGANYISEILKTNKTLKVLDINSNNICAGSAKLIAEGLKGNTTLKELYISDNNIGDDGIKAIIEVLKDNNTLKVLGINKNNIHNGTEHIAELIRFNKTITTMSMVNNDLELCLIEKAVYEHNTTITVMHLLPDELKRTIYYGALLKPLKDHLERNNKLAEAIDIEQEPSFKAISPFLMLKQNNPLVLPELARKISSFVFALEAIDKVSLFPLQKKGLQDILNQGERNAVALQNARNKSVIVR
jgi:Ran GTPase-activating protein (RanGAP) involved in mRNA processing and transport